MRKILVIEDNKDIANLVALHLRDFGCEVEIVLDGDEGLARVISEKFDLLVLDLMLPGVDGLEICRALRAKSDYTPILMLTAKTGELDRVLGLEMGADDYLTKPFSVRELVARVKPFYVAPILRIRSRNRKARLILRREILRSSAKKDR